ncbi:family A1 protease [Epithele typhae]|uniref:family A1 protease n=1 Tax=Epithele typhae TaxID=378194 RepID=UPI002007CE83|nr:family A1 protease [Epithele typhae]KAH9934562.1 family A1 protease [Epithele typhae]
MPLHCASLPQHSFSDSACLSLPPLPDPPGTMLAAHLASFILAAVTFSGADALHIRRDSAPMSLPFVRRVNVTGVPSIIQHDQARAKVLKANRAEMRGFQVVFVGEADSASAPDKVTIGSQTFALLIDTGSSNTWVGAQSNNSLQGAKSAGDLVSVSYGSGFFTGAEVFATVKFPNGLTIANQSLGSAFVTQGITGVDGILGIGPVDLTCGTLRFNKSACIPTVTDNAFSQGLISAHAVGISFQPTTTTGNTNGELTFGGVDTSKFTGALNYVPITSTSPSTQYVGIDQSITYGTADGTTVLPATSGITDTGTTLLLLATDAYKTYMNLTGAVPDSSTGLLSLTPAQFGNLQSLFFHIGDTLIGRASSAQLNAAINGTSSLVYLVVADMGSSSGDGLDFIDGQTFLERFYHVYDIANSRVGFATTPFTYATTN